MTEHYKSPAGAYTCTHRGAFAYRLESVSLCARLTFSRWNFRLTLFRHTDIISVEVYPNMIINELLHKHQMTKYRLAMQAKIPHATLNDICCGKTKIEKCSAETLYKLAKALQVPMELLIEDGIRRTERTRAYEYGLPEYLQHDLDAYKQGLRTHSSLLDCFWGELYGSINIAEINDGVITPEHADYLRQKYLYGGEI